MNLTKPGHCPACGWALLYARIILPTDTRRQICGLFSSAAHIYSQSFGNSFIKAAMKFVGY